MITGFISDIHEDMQNLQKAIRLLEKKGADELIALGDVCGFSERYFSFSRTRSARACWETVLRECTVVVPGNHDLYAIRRIPEFFHDLRLPDSWYDLPLSERKTLGEKLVWLYEPDESEHDLTPELCHSISALPAYQVIERDHLKILLTHFVFPDPTGSATTFLPDPGYTDQHLNRMADLQADLGVFGHQHPEGLLQISRNGMKRMRFRRDLPVEKGSAYGVPPTARGRNRAGICLADWNNLRLKTVPLSYWK